MAKASKKRYSQYSEAINNFGNSAYQELVDKLVDVPHYQLLQLDEACRLLDRMERANKIIETEGLTATTSKGELKEHPAVGIYNKCLTQYYKLVGGLMLTMSAKDKARHKDNSDENKALEALLNPSN